MTRKNPTGSTMIFLSGDTLSLMDEIKKHYENLNLSRTQIIRAAIIQYHESISNKEVSKK